LQECSRAGEFRQQCMLSVGRDLSNEVRIGNARTASQKCELVSNESRLACMRGVVYALIDNTWDGRYALPFCATLQEEDDQNACLKTSAEYLKSTFEKSPAEVAKDCAAYFRQAVRCADLASR
jgi:hypothetical protein